MKYRFYMNENPMAPVRDDWIAAAQDAVDFGVASWISEDQISIDRQVGAKISVLLD